MNIGRKKDFLWSKFEEIQPSERHKCIRAKCKKCGVEMAGLLKRMKVHFEKCVRHIEIDLHTEEPMNENLPIGKF